jgi:L-ascorbate metabolism protein UlaG (beta-lactamase superfamily)
VIEVVAGDRRRVAGVGIEAVPARHWVTPGRPKATPIGYVIDGPRRVWFAGDTGRYPAMQSLAGTIDIALLPVWTWGPHLGPGHLGPRSAAEVLAEIGAPAAVPIHWGTLYPRRLHRLWPGPLDEPGERFAWHARRLAPASDVRMLRPGESTSYR